MNKLVVHSGDTPSHRNVFSLLSIRYPPHPTNVINTLKYFLIYSNVCFTVNFKKALLIFTGIFYNL